MRKLSVNDMLMISTLTVCCIVTAVFIGLYINDHHLKERFNTQQPEQVYTDADILESRVVVADHDKRVAGIANKLSDCLLFDREQCYYNVYLERGFDSKDVVMRDGILKLSLDYENNIQKHRVVAKKLLQIELGLGASK